MQQLGELISSQIGPGCLNSPVASRADGTPDCEVEDVTANPDGTTSIIEIASCAENNNMPPCWQLNDLLSQYQMQGCVPPPGPPPVACKLPLSCQPVTNPVDSKQQLASMSINRGGNPAPAKHDGARLLRDDRLVAMTSVCRSDAGEYDGARLLRDHRVLTVGCAHGWAGGGGAAVGDVQPRNIKEHP